MASPPISKGEGVSYGFLLTLHMLWKVGGLMLKGGDLPVTIRTVGALSHEGVIATLLVSNT
jgi:hypothetical protein